MAAAATSSSDLDLIRAIRMNLGPASARRIGDDHAAVLRTLTDMKEDFSDVNAIYRALLASGEAMVMSKLYRILKVLEEARVIERHWAQQFGRPRSVYCLAGRGHKVAHAQGAGVCETCGVPLQS